MPSPAPHTYLKTRAALLAKQLFSPERLQQLLESSLDTLYQEFGMESLAVLPGAESAINRAVERALMHTLMQELGVLLRPLAGEGRDILMHWARKFELYNLKALIRGKLQGHSFADVEQNLFDLPALISLPHDQLLRTENVLELLRQLEQGHYADIARQARQVYEEKNESFSLDAAIDRSYYLGLLRRIRRIGEADRSALHSLVGTLIDQQNLGWLLRYRFNYGLAPSETYYLLVPFGHHLHRDRLLDLVNLETFPQVIEALPGRLSEPLAGVGDLLDLEWRLERITAAQAHHDVRFSASAVTRSLAYLVLREMDLKHLYAILQGKVLGFTEQTIRSALGGTPVKAELRDNGAVDV
ncbi:MAG: V-type ATPase subunit [Gammaproteobacteria bacterium]|nr:V-type ATPase subunit [Gammaproteobacteria bacterium]